MGSPLKSFPIKYTDDIVQVIGCAESLNFDLST